MFTENLAASEFSIQLSSRADRSLSASCLHCLTVQPVKYGDSSASYVLGNLQKPPSDLLSIHR